MKIISIKETCLYIKDLNLAIDFYHEKLKFPLISHVKGKHAFFRVGAAILLVFNPEESKLKESPPSHYASGKQHIAFEVKPEDYERSKNDITNLGIRITDKITWGSGQESFYFEDPAGNVLEIVPYGVWENG